MKFGLNYSTYKITVAPGKPVKQDVVCTYVRCLDSDGSVMMSVNGARPRIWRTGQWIESPAVSYVTSAGNVPDELVIRTLEFTALEGATAPVSLLIATSTGRDGDDSLSVVSEIPVVARGALPVLTQQSLCPNPPANPGLCFDETWQGDLPGMSEYLQWQGTRGRLWLAATWRNSSGSWGTASLPAGSEVVLEAGFDRGVVVPTDGVLRLFPYMPPLRAPDDDLNLNFELFVRGSQMEDPIGVTLHVWGFFEPL